MKKILKRLNCFILVLTLSISSGLCTCNGSDINGLCVCIGSKMVKWEEYEEMWEDRTPMNIVAKNKPRFEEDQVLKCADHVIREANKTAYRKRLLDDICSFLEAIDRADIAKALGKYVKELDEGDCVSLEEAVWEFMLENYKSDLKSDDIRIVTLVAMLKGISREQAYTLLNNEWLYVGERDFVKPEWIRMIKNAKKYRYLWDRGDSQNRISSCIVPYLITLGREDIANDLESFKWHLQQLYGDRVNADCIDDLFSGAILNYLLEKHADFLTSNNGEIVVLVAMIIGEDLEVAEEWMKDSGLYDADRPNKKRRVS